jgi:hypothetical protein
MLNKRESQAFVKKKTCLSLHCSFLLYKFPSVLDAGIRVTFPILLDFRYGCAISRPVQSSPADRYPHDCRHRGADVRGHTGKYERTHKSNLSPTRANAVSRPKPKIIRHVTERLQNHRILELADLGTSLSRERRNGSGIRLPADERSAPDRGGGVWTLRRRRRAPTRRQYARTATPHNRSSPAYTAVVRRARSENCLHCF